MQKRDAWSNTKPGENALLRDNLNLFSLSKRRLRDDLSSVLSASAAEKH